MPAEKKTTKIRTRDVQGLKYFKVLGRFLERLREVGTERDRAAHQRTLHMDQYGTLILLWLFSPILDSLRGVQQASGFKKLQNKFGISQASLGSLSESVRIFDPEKNSFGTQHDLVHAGSPSSLVVQVCALAMVCARSHLTGIYSIYNCPEGKDAMSTIFLRREPGR